MRTFAPAIEKEKASKRAIKIIGALVQLVRIHACHAWGHGFESRTHRKSFSDLSKLLVRSFSG